MVNFFRKIYEVWLLFMMASATALLGKFLSPFTFFTSTVANIPAQNKTAQVAECRFCTQETINRKCVAETPNFYVFADYSPIVPGHMLIIPKRHVEYFYDIPDTYAQEKAKLTKKIIAVFQDVYKTTQVIELSKAGIDAGQTIRHAHHHILPIQSSRFRWIGQLKMLFKIIFGSRPDGSLETTVLTLRKAFYIISQFDGDNFFTHVYQPINSTSKRKLI